MSELTPVELVVLAALTDRARYGYELVQRIAELTDGRVRIRPGNLYRVIQRLMERGLVTERPAAGKGVDERRRYFRATSAGSRAAAEDLALYGRVLTADWAEGVPGGCCDDCFPPRTGRSGRMKCCGRTWMRREASRTPTASGSGAGCRWTH
jgi:DNA-binding PadR family transcriptional regulator